MRVVTAGYAPVDEPDEMHAATRLILGLTLSTGGMVAASGAATDSALVFAALPSVLMAGLLLIGAIRAAAWCGVAIWLLLMPMTRSEGILSALVMLAICAAVAIGPSRVTAWLSDAERTRDPARDRYAAWIEDL